MDPSRHEASPARQLLLILRRRWRLLLLACLLTTCAGALYTFTREKLYRPTAVLEIRPEAPVVSSDSADTAWWATSVLWDNYFNTQQQILQSPTFGEAVLKVLPEAIRRDFESLPSPGAALASRISVEGLRRSFALRVGVVDPDPEKATQVVNAAVSVYIEEASRRLREAKSTAVAALSTEALPAIRRDVEVADSALQKFKTETGFVDFEEQYASLVEARRKTSSRLVELRLRRAALSAELSSLSDYGAGGVDGVFNPAFHSTGILRPLVEQRARVEEEIARESKELKEGHPRIRELRGQLELVEAKIREGIRGTLQSLTTGLRAAEEEERTLAEEQQRIETEMAEAGRKLTQYRRLSSELTTARDLYGTYLRKHGESTATSGVGFGNVRVIDYAEVPRSPYKPNVSMNLALAAALGLLLGVGAMMLAEQLDDRFLSAGEIEAFVGLDVLGQIPRLTAPAGTGAPVLLAADSPAREFECFRGLRAQVVTRLEQNRGRVIAVVSPMEREGKSTVTANLAKVLAMEGRRVLIFDADMRRPAIRPHFATQEGPGLEEFLKGEVPLGSAVQPSRIPGVDVIGIRKGTEGAAELASSPRYEQALREARERYDVVLVDSTPVNQVSESALIARRTDGAVLVARERQTSRGATAAAKRKLEQMDVKVLGVVLNGATLGASSYGYYSYPKPA